MRISDWSSDVCSSDLRRFAAEEKTNLVEEEDGIATLRLVEIGGGPDDADALSRQGLHHGPEFPPRDRVDADARLVQEQQGRRPQERAGEPELLLHAAGQPPGQAARERSQSGEAQQPVEGRRALAGGSEERRVGEEGGGTVRLAGP